MSREARRSGFRSMAHVHCNKVRDTFGIESKSGEGVEFTIIAYFQVVASLACAGVLAKVF